MLGPSQEFPPQRPSDRSAAAIGVAPASEPSLAALLGSTSRPRRLGAVLGWLVRLPLIGGGFARIMRAPISARFVSTRITRSHAAALRASHGRLRRSWLFAAGQPVLSLTTTGRRSGQSRSTAVACFTSGSDLVIAGMNLGLTSNPAWALNLEADPRATIEIAGRRISVTARRASGQEALAHWRRWLAIQPSAGAFRQIAGRDIPLFVLRARHQAPARAQLVDNRSPTGREKETYVA